MPTAEQVEEQLLDSLRFEDDRWLWEIVWTLNGTHPDEALADKVALSRQVVAGLVKGGVVELWRGEWPDGPVASLDLASQEQLYGDDLSWHDPERAELLVIIRPTAASGLRS